MPAVTASSDLVSYIIVQGGSLTRCLVPTHQPFPVSKSIVTIQAKIQNTEYRIQWLPLVLDTVAHQEDWPKLSFQWTALRMTRLN